MASIWSLAYEYYDLFSNLHTRKRARILLESLLINDSSEASNANKIK